MQCMNAPGIRWMEPICELATGIVLSRFEYRGRTRALISKSGGKDLFVKLATCISEGK